jgi:hypothetical protein
MVELYNRLDEERRGKQREERKAKIRDEMRIGGDSLINGGVSGKTWLHCAY